LAKGYITALAILTFPLALSAQSPFVPGPDETYVEQGTLLPAFTSGQLGWTYSVYVDDSGNVNWLFSDYSTSQNWDGSSFTAPVPALPVWNVYTTATVAFTIEPAPYPDYSATFSDVSITDGCSASGPATLSPSQTTAVATFQFGSTLCNPGDSVLGLEVFGNSSIGLGWSIPTTPGYWSGTEFFPPPEIDYTVTLNYEDPPPPTPEPSYAMIIGLSVAMIAARARWRPGLLWFRRRKAPTAE